MSTQSRQQRRRRRERNYTGVLRRNPTQPARPASQIEPRNGRFRWRIVSLLLVLLLSGLLVFFFTSESFYVYDIDVDGLRYLSEDEVYAYADIDQTHIFWVSPAAVRENLLAWQTIADARVTLGWGAQLVQVEIQEREPAILWEQGGNAVWVDIRGRVMNVRQDRSDLIMVAANTSERILTEGDEIDVEIVYGALELQDWLPETSAVRYDAIKGLGFSDDAGRAVWFGVGTGMKEKIDIYNALAQHISERDRQATEINIVNPDYPYYSIQ